MATLQDILNGYFSGNQAPTLVNKPKANPYDVRTYQQPSTANSGSTAQVYTPPKTTTQSQPAKAQPSSGTPVSLNLRTYQQPSTANSGSTVQTQNTYQQPTSSSSLQNYSFGNNASSSQAQNTYTYVPPPLSTQQSAGTAKSFGLQGMSDNKYTGMTQSQADAQAGQDKAQRIAQTSQGTSYAFNAETISGVNNKFKDLNMKVDSINNQGFVNNSQKKSEVNSVVKGFSSQIAGLFNTPEDFMSAVQNNSDVQLKLAEYEKKGGSVNDIISAINRKNEPQQNAGVQTIDEYLGASKNTTEGQKAYNALLPENKLFQDQIAFQQNIPEQYKDYYWGSEQKIGKLQQDKELADQKVQLLERQAEDAKSNLRAQTDLLIQQNQAKLDSELSTVEQNRLTSRNYVTGMLAKLGALNTTGAAGEGLANLEQKYQQQSQQLRTNYDLQSKSYTIDMNNKLNQIDTNLTDKELTIKSDLSKSEEDAMKEIFKLQNTAQTKTFDITSDFLKMFRTSKDKYIAEAKALAKANAKKAATTASSYNMNFSKFISDKQKGGALLPTLGTNQMPSFIESVLNSGKASLDTQAVLNKQKSLNSYTPSEQTKIQRELTKLQIPNSKVSGGGIPKVGGGLSQARIRIEEIRAEDISGKEKAKLEKAVKQRFIETYPTQTATWDKYFE